MQDGNFSNREMALSGFGVEGEDDEGEDFDAALARLDRQRENEVACLLRGLDDRLYDDVPPSDSTRGIIANGHGTFSVAPAEPEREWQAITCHLRIVGKSTGTIIASEMLPEDRDCASSAEVILEHRDSPDSVDRSVVHQAAFCVDCSLLRDIYTALLKFDSLCDGGPLESPGPRHRS
jgi:hypothetical protein